MLHRVPHGLRAHVKRRHAANMAAVESMPMGKGNRTRAEQSANAWLQQVAGIFEHVVIPLQASDAEVCEKASQYAARAMTYAGRVAGGVEAVRKALAGWVAGIGVVPPVESIDDRPAISRMTCALWWRRAIRKSQARDIERGAIMLETVHAAADVYASESAVQRRAAQVRRNAEALEGVLATNLDTGDQYTLAELAAVSTANPRIRRGELMTRVAGFSAIAKGLGHVCDFVTLTCPSRFHAMLKKAGKRNPVYDGSTPREAQVYLSKVWARFRAAIARRKITLYGFRVAEPHHDGTPHWHLMLFMPKESLSTARKLMAIYALRDSPTEPGASKHRVEFKRINVNRAGGAAAYLAKYLAKNINGSGVEIRGDFETGAAVYPGQRVDAWASTWGIRQFQQVGGAPVGVWRELRRMKQSDQNPDDLNAIIAAADCGKNGKDENGTAGNWRRYVECMGGVACARRLMRFSLAKTREGERWDRVNAVPYPAEPTRYGDVAPPAVYGVEFGGRAYESFRYRWRVGGRSPQNRGARTRVNNCTVDKLEGVAA